MKRPYSELMEKANCVQYALAEKIYQLGRAEAIDKINNAIEELLKEPQYQHEGEDWKNGLIMAQEILYNMSSELKEQNND